MSKTLYEAADFFLLRYALLPKSQVEIAQDVLFQFYKDHTLFQEAIAIASLSLHSSIENSFENKSERVKTFPSLLKYFLRMNSRATPFGLFSAVGWGEFAEKSNLFFSHVSVNKKVQPDGEWIKALTSDFQKQIENVRQLRVMTNFNLVKKSGRVFLRVESEATSSFEFISIKSTVVSDLIFYHARTPILYQDLEKLLIDQFDEHPREVVVEYLWQVFLKGYLLSEYSSSLNQTFSQEFYVNFEKLDFSEELITSFKKYESTPIGKGLDPLREVLRNVDSRKEVKHALQVNAYRKEGIFRLPRSMKERIEETVSLLFHLSNENNDQLNPYYKQFQEKYGMHRLVPLLELIDPHCGLGFFSQDPVDQETNTSLFLNETVLSSFKEKSITLESFPKDALSREQLQMLPPSVELYFELLAQSEEELNKDNYTLVVSPVLGSLQAGSTFGRFLYLFEPSQREQMRHFLKREEVHYSQAMFVQASFLPDKGRIANVGVHEKVRSFHLQMHFHDPSPESIELEDIYVGCILNRLYLYSKKWKKELYITLNSSVNVSLAPAVLQFLLQVSRSRFALSFSNMWKGLEKATYLPRVSYKNVILSQARWLFRFSSLELSEKSSPKEVEKVLRNTLLSFEVPDYIYLSDGDNKIILNWKNKDHFPLLVQHLTNKKILILFEVIGEGKELVVHSEHGKHVAEFVVPLVKKEEYALQAPLKEYPPCEQIYRLDRLQPFGSSWLYFKFFLSKECEEEFLKKYLGPFVRDSLQNGHIDKWFYVRYREEKSHIRLRLHGNPEHLLQLVIPSLYKYSSQWILEGTLGDMSVHTYEKEVERYGGPECMEKAEDIFYADSDGCLNLMENITSLDLPKHLLGALGIINIVRSFYPSTDDQIKLLSPNSQDKHFLKGVREHTPKVVQLMLDLFSDAKGENVQVLVLKEAFEKTAQACEQLNRILCEDTFVPWNNKELVVQSLVHMHCNRFFGADAGEEKKARVTAHYFLEKMHYQLIKESLCQL